jgi:hypothetical protein
MECNVKKEATSKKIFKKKKKKLRRL